MLYFVLCCLIVIRQIFSHDFTLCINANVYILSCHNSCLNTPRSAIFIYLHIYIKIPTRGQSLATLNAIHCKLDSTGTRCKCIFCVM